MSEESFKERLNEALPKLGGLGAIVAFDLGADGKFVVDARGGVAKLAPDDAEPACIIKASGSTVMKLLDGSLDPMIAYTLGKLKVSGSMGLAMKIASALG